MVDSNGKVCRQWTTRVDIEDLTLDLNGWPNRLSSSNDTFRLGMIINRFQPIENKIQIIKWVRNDGIQAWLMNGSAKRLTPSDNAENNRNQFSSLSNYLQ